MPTSSTPRSGPRSAGTSCVTPRSGCTRWTGSTSVTPTTRPRPVSRAATTRCSTPTSEAARTPPAPQHGPGPAGPSGAGPGLAALFVNREAEAYPAVAGVQPARGDRLAPGVEVDALGPVDVRVAEQRRLPP